MGLGQERAPSRTHVSTSPAPRLTLRRATPTRSHGTPRCAGVPKVASMSSTLHYPDRCAVVDKLLASLPPQHSCRPRARRSAGDMTRSERPGELHNAAYEDKVIANALHSQALTSSRHWNWSPTALGPATEESMARVSSPAAEERLRHHSSVRDSRSRSHRRSRHSSKSKQGRRDIYEAICEKEAAHSERERRFVLVPRVSAPRMQLSSSARARWESFVSMKQVEEAGRAIPLSCGPLQKVQSPVATMGRALVSVGQYAQEKAQGNVDQGERRTFLRYGSSERTESTLSLHGGNKRV